MGWVIFSQLSVAITQSQKAMLVQSAGGRFGNKFFRNMGLTVLAEIYNVSAVPWYEDPHLFRRLGIDLCETGIPYDPTKKDTELDDANFFEFIANPKRPLHTNLRIKPSQFQTRDFCFFLRSYFTGAKKQGIIEANLWKERYGKNNDVFVHVRLGDASHVNPGLDYYKKALGAVEATTCFLSSDSLGHEICQNLLRQHKAIPFHKSELETVMFASTCKYLVLSQGTFSWLMGFLAFFSEKIFFPKIVRGWHGNIFVLPQFIEVS